MEKEGRLEERDWLYSLYKITGVGRKSIRTILERWETIASFVDDCRADHKLSMPIEGVLRQYISVQMTAEQVRRDKRERAANNIPFISILDQQYPQLLRHIADPPLILFYRGKLSWLQKPILAVVGSRKPTPYGKAACAEITKQLVDAGMVIASGVAYGIDAEAHRTSLRLQAGTIGVLGCGIDQVYPPLHRPLYREIEDSGLLLSEYLPGTPPLPGYFPERNRIISGLALGVVIIEAAVKSGSLVTAQLALEQGREVFAVPGPIFSELSAGPHNLIKDGAKLVTGWEDIHAELTHLMPKAKEKTVAKESPSLLTSEAASLLERITYAPIHWDEIYETLDPDLRRTIDQELLHLEAKGYIAGLPGGFFTRRM